MKADNENAGHFGPWWKFYLARIFGEKAVGYDSGMKITLYRWRGVLYVWRVELDTDVPV